LTGKYCTDHLSTMECKQEDISTATEFSYSVTTASVAKSNRGTVPPTHSKEECQNTKNKVDIHQAGFPTHSVLGPDNIVISGDSIHNRVCTLKGVVKFTYIDGSVQAQMDPNLRNPLTMTPLCFPMATMTFFAGVASNASSPIQSNVIVQVEPHGRIRIVVPKMFEGVIVRLDGITYAPLMEFNVPPSQCAPYCFPLGKDGGNMTSTGCIKYCTPVAFERTDDGSLQQKACQCDMLKRLECWKHENSTELKCGQYKQLLRMYKLVGQAKKPMGQAECGKLCAEQLSGL